MMIKWMKRGALLLTCTLLVPVLAPVAANAQVEGIIEKADTGQTLRGRIRWRASSKVYEINPEGSRVVTTVPLHQVANLRLAQVPDGLEAAARRVEAGSYKGPHIQRLEAIVNDYLMLQYDLVAGRWLGEAMIRTGQAEEAERLCERILADRPKSSVSPAFLKVYWDALVETESYSTLRDELSWAIENGSREMAATAQMTRGKMDMQRKEFRSALVDGFLRTILMFSSVRDVQAEALYNAATCFEELGESTHAAKMRKKLLAEFPNSEYSRKLETGG